MTELLAKAFAKAAELPEEEQDVIAALILKELESEARWDELFEATDDGLAKLADEALREHKAGRTKRLNIDEL